MRVKLTLAATCVLAVLVSAGPAAAVTLKVDDDKVQCKTPYTDIQSAIDAASTGDTIQVCPGTYTGPIRIDKSITVNSMSRRAAIINAPATQATAADTSVVKIIGSGVSARLNKFVINAQTATADGGCNGDIYGVRIVEGATGVINDNDIMNARPSDPNLNGCQYGIAVGVGGYYGTESGGAITRTTGTGTVTNNDIHGYAKLGVYVDNNTTKATVRNNTITGDGCVDYIAQNGIQVSRGAKGTVQTNTIKNNCYTKQDGYLADGILLYKAGNGTVVGGGSPTAATTLGNTLKNNDLGLDVESTQKSKFGFNTITGSGTPGGLGIANYKADPPNGLPVSSLGNQYFGNTATSDERFDCYDETDGLGTANTGNTWTNDHGDTSSPAGICQP